MKCYAASDSCRKRRDRTREGHRKWERKSAPQIVSSRLQQFPGYFWTCTQQGGYPSSSCFLLWQIINEEHSRRATIAANRWFWSNGGARNLLWHVFWGFRCVVLLFMRQIVVSVVGFTSLHRPPRRNTYNTMHVNGAFWKGVTVIRVSVLVYGLQFLISTAAYAYIYGTDLILD